MSSPVCTIIYVDFPAITSTLHTSVEGEYCIALTLTFPVSGENQKIVTANFKIDSGCRPDLVITQELATELGIVADQFKSVPIISPTATDPQVFPFTENPVGIAYTTGRTFIRSMNSSRCFIASKNLLGRMALAELGISLPADASKGVVYIYDFDDEIF